MRSALLLSAFVGSIALSMGACSSASSGGGVLPEGGAGTGGGGSGGGSPGTDCQSLCQKLASAGCPNTQSQAECQAECLNPPFLASGCKPIWDTYVSCVATQGGATCSGSGSPMPTGCDGQLGAYTACQNSGTGGDGGAPSGGGGSAGAGNAPSGGGGAPPVGGGGAPSGGGGPSGGGAPPVGGGGAPPVGGGGGPTGGGGAPVGGGGGPSGGGGSGPTWPGTCWTGPTTECNPLTNAGCASGEACDYGDDGSGVDSLYCFPPPNTVALNGACSNSAGPYCQATLHCSGAPGTCRKFCCSNADCTGGTCTALSTTGTIGYCN